MPSRAVQQTIIAVVAAVGLVLSLLSTHGHSLESGWGTWLRVYSISVTTVGLLFLAHDRLLWRLPILNFGRPRLAGTWRGRLTSTYVAPGGEEFKDLLVHLLIHQTFSTVSATLMSERSESESNTVTLRCGMDRRWHLSWTYRNVPRPGERLSSAQHQGATDLVVGGAHGELLRAHYFTDRRSDGEIVFDLWSKTAYGDAVSAAAATDFAQHRSTG
jgi:SMODS-associating 2TM, beta-strand rich effector domain